MIEKENGLKTDYLEKLRSGAKMSLSEQIRMILALSFPAILAQLSSIIMEYIDASMVGHLSSSASASIGLVSSSTWIFGGLCMAANVGFNVQIAHKIGAGEDKEARNIVKQGLILVFAFSMLLLLIGAGISQMVPALLGGEMGIRADASKYFLVYALFIPIMQINGAATGMLQCSGNMKLPSILHIVMCALDVVFNLIFIFPTRTVILWGNTLKMPGFGMGVTGAALGTALAELVVMLILLYFLLFRSEKLRLRSGERLHFSKIQCKSALKLALPVAAEQVVICSAYIMSTKIVAPLGSVAIAANSFSITAESLCYMPGYGISSAATTLIGQSVGAKRKDMTKKLGWVLVLLGMGIMTVSGGLMYAIAPWMIGVLSPDTAIRQLGASVLRIEAFAEPFYGASIVANGVFRGAGDTLMPSCMNFISMWVVRLPLAAYLSRIYGLKGAWIAMCVELIFRGCIFLLRLAGKKWYRRINE